MNIMRKDGSGTFDHSTSTWKLRRKGKPTIAASTRFLATYFGVEIAKSERESRPYWDEYLAARLKEEGTPARVQSPLAKRISSLEEIIARLQQERQQWQQDRLAFSMETGLPAKAGAFPEYPVTLYDTDSKTAVGYIDLNDAVGAGVATPRQKSSSPSLSTVSDKIAHYITLYIEEGKTAVAEQHKVLGWLAESCGALLYNEINVEHYLATLDKIKANSPSPASRVTRQKTLKAFLRCLRSDHNLPMGWLDNKRYNFKKGDGSKEQYTIEQVQLALSEAKGVERTVLLLGLNAGMYFQDVHETKPEHFDGTYLVHRRSKHKRLPSPLHVHFKLWPETVEALTLPVSHAQATAAYARLMERCSIPSHKALRKTVTQWLHDGGHTEAARLYRSEKLPGCHGSHYVKLSEAQQAMLDKGLAAVREKIFA